MTDSRALITGASAGLGAEFARQLAESGKDLILVARRMEPMEKLAARLRDDYGIDIDIIQADLSEPAAPAAIYAEVAARALEIEMLINNAGAAGPDLLDDRDWPAQQRYLELMTTSVAAMCHFFIPPMCERGFGRVINVASVAGLVSLPGDTSYGPAKAYLVALSKGLAATVRPAGVNVLALCPGFTHTDFHQAPKLADMKKSSPGILWYDADVVIREALQAAAAGKDVLVTGRLYRWAVPILRTRLGTWIAARMGVKRNY